MNASNTCLKFLFFLVFIFLLPAPLMATDTGAFATGWTVDNNANWTPFPPNTNPLGAADNACTGGTAGWAEFTFPALAIPGGDSLDGITVNIKYRSAAAQTVQLKNSGSNVGSTQNTPIETSGPSNCGGTAWNGVGGAADTWGTSLTVADFNAGTVSVRITFTSTTLEIDAIELVVTHSAPGADLSIIKSDNPDPVIAGNNLTYTVTVSNAGPLSATDVVVTDTLPAGVSFVSTSGCAEDANGVPTCSLGTIASGANAQYTVIVTVDPATSGSITNDVSVTSAVTDPDPDNNSTSQSTTVTQEADLSVSKSGSPDPVVAGNNLTYTVTVSNAGPSDAANVVATDTLPAGTTLVSTTGCAEDPNGVATCSLGTIAAGGNAQYTIIVAVDSAVADGANLSNTVSVASDTTDPIPGNDSTTEDTTVNREVDITVTKTESIDPVVAGSGAGNLVYTITATNNGPSDVTGATFTEDLVLPAGVSVDSVAPSTGATGGSSPNFTWTGVDIAAGNSATLTVTLTAAASAVVATDSISDTATFTGSTGGETITDTDDDSATESTSVAREVDITVTKTESIDPVVAGSGAGNLTYVVTAMNNGPSDVTDLVISDAITVPANVTIDSVTPSNGLPAWSSPDWTVSLASGASATLTVVITVPLTALEGADVISDTATVESSGGGETFINTDDDSITVATSIRWPEATFRVSKEYEDGEGPAVDVTLTCTDTSGLLVYAPQQGTTQTSLTVRRFDISGATTSCTVTEIVPDFFYEFDRTADCDVTAVDGAANAEGDGVYECTITNAKTLATFHVTKDFVPNDSMEVEVFISCNDGLPLKSDQVITEGSDGVTFIVELFIAANLDCEITEVPVPGGYDDSYTAGIVDGEAGFIGNTDGCQFEEVVSGDFSCAITNTAMDATYEVNKFWDVIGEGGDRINQVIDISISCTEEILSASPAPDSGPGFFQGRYLVSWLGLEGNTTVRVTVDSSNGTASCRARETVFTDAVEIDNPCSNDRSLTMGQTTHCTITNTVFFEGIPTLNQYGLALMALLMLGIGAVGFRRFV